MISRQRFFEGNKKAKKAYFFYHEIMQDYLSDIGFPLDAEHKKRFMGMYRKTRVFSCGKACCINPRRLGELTRKELSANVDFKEQLNELVV